MKKVKSKKLNARQRRTALKRLQSSKTKGSVFSRGRQRLFALLRDFVSEFLKPMRDLPLCELFVFSDATAFEEHVFPPTMHKRRARFLGATQFLKERADKLEVREEVEEEAMCRMFAVFSECDDIYLNLHDAYVSFKARFDASDDDEEIRMW